MNYDQALKIFGLSEDCTTDDIEIAFKRLASKNHPDSGGNNTEMADLNVARDTLMDFHSPRNMPLLVKQFEIAIRDSSQASMKQRAIEKKAKNYEKKLRGAVTNKLKMWKKISVILASISSGTLFLVTLFGDYIFDAYSIPPWEKPTEVVEPIEPPYYQEYLEVGSDVNKIQDPLLEESWVTIHTAIHQYEQNLERYLAYRRALLEWEDLEKIRLDHENTFRTVWISILFNLLALSSFGAWFFRHKITVLEDYISDIEEEMTFKAEFVKLLMAIKIDQEKWTLEELQKALDEALYFSDSSEKITSPENLRKVGKTVGTKKLAQLILLKAQKLGHITSEQSKSENIFEEFFYLT